jgi:hypothetical protein
MVAPWIAPDNTSQVGNEYKGNIDNAIVAGARVAIAFLPQAQDAPDMTIKVLGGALMISGGLTEIAAQNTGTIAAPVGNPRIDRVVLDPSTGAVELVTGTVAASPVAPTIPDGRLPICRFQLETSTTAIANSMIVDERAAATGTAALYDVGTGSNQIPRNSDLSTGTATITAGEALADRDLIYQDVFNQRGGGADRWYEVDTDTTVSVRIGPRIGIALAAIASGASGSAQLRAGRVSGFSGLTAGQAVFASATAGAVTQTAPAIPASGTQNATRLIGYAASATEIDFDPEDDTVFTARNSSVAVDGTLTVQHWVDTGGREREQAAYLVQVSSTAAVSGGTGTSIGDFTSAAGLAAVFNGFTSQSIEGSGTKVGTSGYVGKTYSPGKSIQQAVVYGSFDAGYVRSINPTVTLVLRGKTGTAPASRTDGTQLGTLSFTDTGNESASPRTVASTDQTTVWNHVWIDFSHNGASSECAIAEITFTEITGTARDEPLTIGGSIANATSTDRVNVRYDDGAGANADTRTTFINRTGATRDLVGEVVL